MVQDCFKYIVGLSGRDCDCHFAGRPDAANADWRHEWAVTTADGDFVFTTAYTLPEDTTTASIQGFVNGALVAVGSGITVTDDAELTFADLAEGDHVQVWYKAAVPAANAYTESVSGLHITDLLPEEELTGLAGCDETLWDLLTKARTAAVSEFRAALNARVQERYTAKHKTFTGNIGKREGNGPLSTTNAFAGVHVRTNGVRAGYLKVHRILAMFERPGTANMTVFDQYGTVVCPAFSLTVKPGQGHINTVNLKLPLLDAFNDEQHYFFVYEYDAANRPLLNKTACSSCDTSFIPSRDTQYPVFQNRRDKHGWANYLVLGGWTGDDIDTFTGADVQVTEYCNGLSFDVEIGCDLGQGMCGLLDGFDSNPWAMSVATAIQRKAAAWLVDRRLTSSRANRNNAVNKDDLRAQVGKWEAEYAEILHYLSTNIPPDVNECLECSPRVRRGEILT